jgi:Lrp/AsnC family transcriptional regulator for asnA, asnC and gidA
LVSEDIGFGFGRHFFVAAKLTYVSTESTEDRILAALERDAQASYAEIAERADVSKPTVRKYVEKLESEGVIVGYSADVDPKKLSSQTIALVGIEVESDKYVEATRELKQVSEIRVLYSSTGDHTLMAEVRETDGEGVGEVISEDILGIEGVAAAHPSFLQERLK